MRAWEVQQGSTSLDGLKLVSRPDPKPGAGQVVVRVRAASLNARDQGIMKGRYGGGAITKATIPLSDGAGEVVALGDGVSRFKSGDKVMAIFNVGWIDGPNRPENRGRTLGGPLDGMLTELALCEERDLVAMPDYLSFEEAACLPCAGVTAWHALFEKQPLIAGESVLVIGTGGVAVFGIQFAKMIGAQAFAVSSSDDKLQRAKKIGLTAGVNYKTTPEWQGEIVKLSGGGVTHVIEVGGQTLPKSIASMALGGHIHMIGFVSGQQPTFAAPEFVRKMGTIDGLLVGSRAMFERMCAAISAHKLKPVIDRTFAFDEAKKAYEYQSSPDLFGKVVITI
jgi:NADPH:quinone reductase-like Zn-dependent oxidoreductase